MPKPINMTPERLNELYSIPLSNGYEWVIERPVDDGSQNMAVSTDSTGEDKIG